MEPLLFQGKMMATLLCLASIFLVGLGFIAAPVLSCNTCIHRSKLAYYGNDSPIKAGACGYGSFAARLNGKNVAAASPKLYRNGVGCSACYQIRCLDPKLCSRSGQKTVITDLTNSNQTDFVVPMHTFASLALPKKGRALRKKGIVDIEYKRIFCEYKGKNLFVKVDGSSQYPYYLAVQFLFQGGQTDIVSVDVAQVGEFNWKSLTRNHGAVWDISNPPEGGLQFRFLVTSGFDGYMLWAKRAVLPQHWKAGGLALYDTGLQINQTAQEGCTNSCDLNDRV